MASANDHFGSMDSVRLSWHPQPTPRVDPTGKRGYSSLDEERDASEDPDTHIIDIPNSFHLSKRSRVSSPDSHHEGTALYTTENTILYHPKPVSAEAGRARFLENLVASEQPGRGGKQPNEYVSHWINSLEFQTRCWTSVPELPPASLKEEHRAQRSASAPVKMPPQMPPTPASTFGTPPIPPFSRGRSTISSNGKRDTESIEYRTGNLLQNRVTVESRHFVPQPDNIAQLLRDNARERPSPSPSETEIQMDDTLHDLKEFTAEFRVEEFFKGSNGILYVPAKQDVLQRDSRLQLKREAVPSNPQANSNIATPVPDTVYGYKHARAFTLEHMIQLEKIPGVGPANGQSLYFPFFVVEFKGHSGSMSAATSQCMGGSASCVTLAENLNSHIQRLRQAHRTCNLADIETAAYSLAVNGSEAKLYVTWKQEDGSFKMQKVSVHHIQEPGQYIELRKKVRNLLDWGRTARLRQIHELLDYIREN
ncbi:hypothetical protein F503_00452 [Ophiostoma piceae UAMH 11346]|uniref:DUF7924 domain-containing protein n=1 Tax=Ophiostoma piceae (strain UAMH 11346) TaxID=1262450 RepID=S3D368_OPHP1|nr:hypothetical protein F503_00452 [Ophiostoma piceae UAMH 11346]